MKREKREQPKSTLPKRAKLIIISAGASIVLLLVLCLATLINISILKNKISTQSKEISRLESSLNYYENQSSDDKDNKSPDIELVPKEEE